jgi:hypothetical protein
MENRRRHDRRRTLKSGKIMFNHKTSVVDCTIRNLSMNGACLLVDSVIGIPETFDLVLDGVRRCCVVKWKTGDRVSVSFSG